jgi:hypothetical protein
MWISIKKQYKHNHGRQGYLYKLWDSGPDGVAQRRGPTEKPNGAMRVARDTQWVSRADGHLDGCPTEGGRAPDGGEQVPNGGRMGARWRAGVARRRARWVPDEGQGLGGWPNGGSRGWPNEGLYKCCWPSFLGTLLRISCRCNYLQEMRERRVLMTESGPLRGEFRKECSPHQCFYD